MYERHVDSLNLSFLEIKVIVHHLLTADQSIMLSILNFSSLEAEKVM